MADVKVGKKIPAFRGEATGGSTIASKDLAGRKFVLYFYPRDDTPGCTTESKDFRDLHAKFERKGVGIIGVSRDTLKSHERFKEKLGFPFELIADPDEMICNLFGVMKDKNMYGKKVRGIERSTFLVDEKGVLLREWRKVKVDGHAQEVLDSLT
ncbi:MAG TPA: peroxiredoxin [Gammaproteobacteria bacterium]|nr:peroxiredoxin [Gammaproteobacteria bacterium]